MDHHDILNNAEGICTFKVVGAAINNVSLFHLFEFDKWNGTEKIGYKFSTSLLLFLAYSSKFI